MNTFSYFIIGILLLSNQALAAKAVAEKIERISVDTFHRSQQKTTMDEQHGPNQKLQ
jgi:hypothetical protein